MRWGEKSEAWWTCRGGAGDKLNRKRTVYPFSLSKADKFLDNADISQRGRDALYVRRNIYFHYLPREAEGY